MSITTVPITGTIDAPLTLFIKNSVSFSPWEYKVSKQETVTSLIADPEHNVIRVPRNLKKFIKIMKLNGVTIKFIDKRVTNSLSKDLKLKENFKLRPYQRTAVTKVLETLLKTKENAVILKAPPGFGKSYIIPYIVKELGQKTLIIVDRVDLVKQMYSEFLKNIEEGDYHILSTNDREIRDVNISTFQFLIRNPELVRELAKEIGFVIIDESHVISIGAFTQIVNNLPAKYRLGLSATPTRSDGLTGALRDVMSDNLVIADNPTLLGVKIIMARLPFFFSSIGKTPQKAWADFYTQPPLTSLIVALTKKMLSYKRAPLIYATYSKVQKHYQKMLAVHGVSSKIIDQKTPKEEREKILKDFQDRKFDVLISGTILQKGISIHRLDTIINLANHTKESLEQLVGRLRRDSPDKKSPVIFDFYFEGAAMWKALDREMVYSKIVKAHKKDNFIIWTEKKFKEFIGG